LSLRGELTWHFGRKKKHVSFVLLSFFRNFARKKQNMAEHNELGHWGEEVAADYLRRKGYTIVERDWQSGHYDIDIIAMDEDTLVFVEVKTRRNRMFTEPETAVNYQKIRNLRQAANHYVKYRHANEPIRFDIVTVVGTQKDVPEINHIPDAF
jgi:putative endonuclease